MSHSLKYGASGKFGGTHTEDRMILTPGRILTDENCSEMDAQIKEAIEQNKTEIIIDCTSLGFLDSAMLEMLIQAHSALKSRGGRLKIIRLNDVCRDILLATRTIKLFFVYKDMQEAMAYTP